MNQLNNHGSSLPHHRLLAYQKSLELLAAAAVAPRRDLLREDLIQIEFGNGVVLDVGWYPEFSSDGAFGLVVIDVGDERRMLLALTSKPTVFFSHSAQDAEARHRRHRPSDHGQTRLHLVEDDRWQIGQDKQTLLRRRQGYRESPTGEAVPVRVVEVRRVTLRVPLNRTPEEVDYAQRLAARGAPRDVTFLPEDCSRITAPCRSARDWCGDTDCGETHFLMEFEHSSQWRATLPELNRARWPLARCLSGVTISADESSRVWTIHVRAGPEGGVEVGEVTAAHWIAGGRSDIVCERRHRVCFETVLRAIRLKKAPAAEAAFDWVLSVSRTEDKNGFNEWPSQCNDTKRVF